MRRVGVSYLYQVPWYELASTHPAGSTACPKGLSAESILRARSDGALKEAQERAGCVSASHRQGAM